MLVGCVSKPPTPDLDRTEITRIEYVAYECGQPPGVSPVRYHGLGWDVRLIRGRAYWTLDAEGYEDLGKNTSITIEAVKQVIGQRNFWRKCVEDSLARLEELKADDST